MTSKGYREKDFITVAEKIDLIIRELNEDITLYNKMYPMSKI